MTRVCTSKSGSLVGEHGGGDFVGLRGSTPTLGSPRQSRLQEAVFWRIMHALEPDMNFVLETEQWGHPSFDPLELVSDLRKISGRSLLSHDRCDLHYLSG
jgi:hypothetical protein